MERIKLKLWISAVNAITADREARVLCPSCGKQNLVAQVIWSDGKGMSELHVACPQCGKETFVRTPLSASWERDPQRLQEGSANQDAHKSDESQETPT